MQTDPACEGVSLCEEVAERLKEVPEEMRGWMRGGAQGESTSRRERLQAAMAKPGQ